MDQRPLFSQLGLPLDRPAEGENGWHVEWCESEEQGVPSMLIGISATSAGELVKRLCRTPGVCRIKAYEIK